MPSERTAFTPSSILVRPHRNPPSQHVPTGLPDAGGFVVEAPGTAPGSDRFITQTVYRHSQVRPDTPYIGPYEG